MGIRSFSVPGGLSAHSILVNRIHGMCRGRNLSLEMLGSQHNGYSISPIGPILRARHSPFSGHSRSIEGRLEQACDGDRHVTTHSFSSLIVFQSFLSSPDSVNFLPPDVCATKIVQGVITNQKFLYIPKYYRLLEFMKRLAMVRLG